MNRELSVARPTSVSHLIGQEKVVQQVKVALDAAHQDGKRFPHTMLVGPQGLGKTAVGEVIAAEMAAEYSYHFGQNLATKADLNELLLEARDKCVIHIDEAHELKRPLQTSLYRVLDRRQMEARMDGSLSAISIADFTLLLSTTDEYRINGPLRDRMKITLSFDFYSDRELHDLLHRRATAVGWEFESDLLFLIPKRSRGTPRQALRLLEATHRVARADGKERVDVNDFIRACELEQLDSRGLGSDEQKYLRQLTRGAMPLNVLATVLCRPSRTVSKVIEPFLIRSGLIVKDAKGWRKLTEAGHDHLSDSCPNDV